MNILKNLYNKLEEIQIAISVIESIKPKEEVAVVQKKIHWTQTPEGKAKLSKSIKTALRAKKKASKK